MDLLTSIAIFCLLFFVLSDHYWSLEARYFQDRGLLRIIPRRFRWISWLTILVMAGILTMLIRTLGYAVSEDNVLVASASIMGMGVCAFSAKRIHRFVIRCVARTLRP